MADVEKRKQYIRALSCAANHADDGMITVSVDEVREIIDLLKEKEPRVLTLDEVQNTTDFVWGEFYTTRKWDWCVCYVKVKAVPGNDEILSIDDDCGTGWTKLKSEYGKRGFLDGGWRCWTSRPTEEQRKNTPWRQ